ncbi:MAG: STAS domain-containing protein [Cytophagales bacterium]|nr:STAS domain-containing protein [Cytophagales bacterium]
MSKITATRQEDYTILKVDESKLIVGVAPKVTAKLVVLKGEGVKNLILDISGVKYIDSSGLSALLMANRLFSKEGRCLFVVATDYVKKLIEIAQLHTILQIFPSVEKAIDAIKMKRIEKNSDKDD